MLVALCKGKKKMSNGQIVKGSLFRCYFENSTETIGIFLGFSGEKKITTLFPYCDRVTVLCLVCSQTSGFGLSSRVALSYDCCVSRPWHEKTLFM